MRSFADQFIAAVCLILVAICFAGCGVSKSAAAAASADAPKQLGIVTLEIHVVTVEAPAAAASNTAAGVIVDGMTPANVLTEKPKAKAKIEETGQHIANIQAAATQAAPAAAAASKEVPVIITRLQQDEAAPPAGQGWLEWGGGALAGICIAGLFAKLYPTTAAFTPAAKYLAAGIVIGAGAWYLGYHLRTIEAWLEWGAVVIGSAGLIFLAYEVYEAKGNSAAIQSAFNAAVKEGSIVIGDIEHIFHAPAAAALVAQAPAPAGGTVVVK